MTRGEFTPGGVRHIPVYLISNRMIGHGVDSGTYAVHGDRKRVHACWEKCVSQTVTPWHLFPDVG